MNGGLTFIIFFANGAKNNFRHRHVYNSWKTTGVTPMFQQQTQGLGPSANSNISERKAAAPPAIVGDNISIAWLSFSIIFITFEIYTYDGRNDKKCTLVRTNTNLHRNC